MTGPSREAHQRHLCAHNPDVSTKRRRCVHSPRRSAYTQQRSPGEPSGRLTRFALAVTLALVAALSPLAACGSSGSSAADATAAPVKTSITSGVPKDASSEPPWNGRFVQVNVTTAKPGAMSPDDWSVTVNGKEPELDKPVSILAYSPHGATVEFVFRTPYTDLGTYKFRVTYTPKDGPKVERSWDYKW